MKSALFATLLCAAIAAPAFAADTGAKEPTAQQQRMKNCNADAKTKALTGDERKTFMKGCLSGDTAFAAKAATDKQAAQREKMKTCNADAKTKALKGDERKKFMSACLSN